MRALLPLQLALLGSPAAVGIPNGPGLYGQLLLPGLAYPMQAALKHMKHDQVDRQAIAVAVTYSLTESCRKHKTTMRWLGTCDTII